MLVCGMPASLVPAPDYLHSESFVLHLVLPPEHLASDYRVRQRQYQQVLAFVIPLPKGSVPPLRHILGFDLTDGELALLLLKLYHLHLLSFPPFAKLRLTVYWTRKAPDLQAYGLD